MAKDKGVTAKANRATNLEIKRGVNMDPHSEREITALLASRTRELEGANRPAKLERIGSRLKALGVND